MKLLDTTLAGRVQMVYDLLYITDDDGKYVKDDDGSLKLSGLITIDQAKELLGFSNEI